MNNGVKSALKWIIPANLRPRLKLAWRKIRHFGFAFQCPFCHARLRGLLPFGATFPVLKEKRVVGAGYRRNAICPVCRSWDRERLLYLYLLHESDLFSKPHRVLHLAPESQLEKILRRNPDLAYVTGDLLAPNVMVRMDVTRIPLPDASFDVVLCNHVLPQVPEDQKAMAELFRVMKPGGWAILQVAKSQTLDETIEDLSIATGQGREQAFGEKDSFRIYGRDYNARLARAGFRVEEFSWLDKPELFGGRENRFSLIQEERIHVARKPRAV